MTNKDELCQWMRIQQSARKAGFRSPSLDEQYEDYALAFMEFLLDEKDEATS